MKRNTVAKSPILSRQNDVNHTYPGDPGLHAQAFQQQLLQLKKQQQLQQQILLQHYQTQQQQLAEQHEQQLRHHLKEFREQQKALEEQKERREKEKLEALKRKDKHEQSAVASSEVKQRLQGFLLNKKQREAAANGTSGPLPGSASFNRSQQWGEPPSSTPSGAGAPHPYHLNHLVAAKYDEDFPLRKTASEPNLLKVRLKQRVIERRASPMARRNQRLISTLKKKSVLVNAANNSTETTSSNSPPVVTNLRTSPSAAGSTPIREEPESPTYGQLSNSSQQGSMSDLSLYSSPSMPNISLGRPPSSHNSGHENKLASVSEAEVRAAFTARLGMPLTGQMLPGTLPFYPTLPAIDSEPTDSAAVHKQMETLEQSGNPTVSGYQQMTDSQVAHARLTKHGHRPLGRTQSAPLPLGHPMLASHNVLTIPQRYEDQRTQHNLLKQQIRQTVLTRAGRQLEDQPEVVDETAEVIDLTDQRLEVDEDQNECEMSRQQKDREQFLQQQRDLMMRHNLQANEGSTFVPRNTSYVARPLSRALSSPLVALGGSDIPLSPVNCHSSHVPKLNSSVHCITTGLAFDNLMLKHACVCGDNSSHPEHGGRLQSVWARLLETGLVARCDRLRARKATIEEIQSCHSEAHALLFGTNPLNRQKLDINKIAALPIKCFVRLPCGGVGVDSDTTWNELHTAPAARMAVGCVVDLAMKTAMGDMKNGFAVVRPPGHHAENSQAMGFCFFNSVAIAAKLLQQRLRVRKILIFDWDVHHGNGTQQMFYDDPHVLYLSVHRHDDGNFFPGTGGPTECGTGEGLGYNVNIAFSGGLQPPMGDAEYLAAFRTIVMPIAKKFDPDIVLVSAGFDAAAGHPPPLGGYKVSASCFGHMTQELLNLADGKVVLALEGGYDLPSICDAAQECVRALLGDDPTPISEEELTRPPCQAAVDTMQKTIAIQLTHWPCLKKLAHTVGLPYAEKEKEDSDTITRMAGLSMQQNQYLQSPERTHRDSEEPMEEDEGK
ncbi:histone deacetylase 7A, putative [Pediculus humanus corporis]|uniref:Histone deacetylase n=1 Tax=Pediculus humanus subsp. corporis TaxID=121224 RepID=E0VLQ7_PEDHC|nr:histone deacetylase 7A, putative [Pediculus humanus corporis]EEB14313.1 histone deacetylase 7A, putative [Pediculus humanus corporis]